MTRWLSIPLISLVVFSGALVAQEYRVEPFKDVPPPDAISEDVAAQLSPTGFKVMQGEKRLLCEIWLAKEWDVKPDFKPSASVLYPLKVGSLVGALRFGRKGADFRGQEIPSGVYTLRYGNQPVDGNHVGTFDTRDFLLLVPASADTSPAPIAEMDLFKVSALAAESTHPAIMPLLKPDGQGELPALQHLAQQEWWTVRFGGQGAGGKKVVLEAIVVGKAAE